MSAISSSTTNQFSVQRPTPHGSGHNRLASTIGSELSSGALSSTDATALTGALDAIDASLSSDDPSSTTGSNSTDSTRSRLDPASMKDRIDSLIAGQVDSGALTSDQASELKNLFASGGRSTADSDSLSGPSGAGGPPPGPPPGQSQDDTSSTSGSSTSDLLSSFLQQLQASQSSNARYGANGSSQYGANASALLVDFSS
jgi:hypothetical protein